MKTTISIFVLFLTINISFSQVLDITTLRNVNGVNAKTNKYKHIEGTPYLNNAFISAKISGYGETLYNSRLNAYTGDIEVKLSDKVIVLDKNKDNTVAFVNNKTYKNFAADNDKLFYEVIKETQQYSILKLESVRLREAQKAKNSYSKSKPAMFVRKSDAYFIKKGNTIQEIELKKKSLLALSEKNSKAIKDFLKKENINLKNEVDLTKAIDFVMKL